MDLTLFIVLIVVIFMIYYLLVAIQSLIKELKEVKTKCIKTNNSKEEDFTINTPDPSVQMSNKLIDTLGNLQTMFNK